MCGVGVSCVPLRLELALHQPLHLQLQTLEQAIPPCFWEKSSRLFELTFAQAICSPGSVRFVVSDRLREAPPKPKRKKKRTAGADEHDQEDSEGYSDSDESELENDASDLEDEGIIELDSSSDSSVASNNDSMAHSDLGSVSDQDEPSERSDSESPAAGVGLKSAPGTFVVHANDYYFISDNTGRPEVRPLPSSEIIAAIESAQKKTQRP